MTLLDLLILSAASWYISYALTGAYGPGGIFDRLREFKGGRWHGRGVKQGIVDTRINELGGTDMKIGDVVQTDGLLDCIVCLIFWVAQLLALATGHTVLEGLAVAGVALWVHSFTGIKHTF